MLVNRFPFKTVALAAAIIAAPLVQAAGKYNEPTRGFFIESGEVAPSRKASVELETGRPAANNPFLENRTGGGIRLGLSNAEVLINSGLGDYDQNELMVKWGMPRSSGNSGINWALLGGISQMNYEVKRFGSDAEIDQLNLKAGAALTIRADAGIFTIQPLLVYADGEVEDSDGDKIELIDDTFLELGLGAYVGLADTEAGKFSIGVEALITTQDNQYGADDDDDADKDNTFALGVKWAYSERVHLDIVPLVHSNDELLGIPGLVRLNVAF